MPTTEDTNEPHRTDENTNRPRCDNCGEDVTREYHRVLSDNKGFPRSCLHYTSKCQSRGEWL